MPGATSYAGYDDLAGEGLMAKTSKKHIGVGSQGKRDGSGGMTEVEKEKIPENMVLSNRDKASHPPDRGLDGKEIQTEQLQDHSGNRIEE